MPGRPDDAFDGKIGSLHSDCNSVAWAAHFFQGEVQSQIVVHQDGILAFLADKLPSRQ